MSLTFLFSDIEDSTGLLARLGGEDRKSVV